MQMTFISKLIEAELDLGHVINVQRYSKVFHHAFPDLSHDDIHDLVAGLVVSRSSSTAWGWEQTVDLIPRATRSARN